MRSLGLEDQCFAKRLVQLQAQNYCHKVGRDKMIECCFGKRPSKYARRSILKKIEGPQRNNQFRIRCCLNAERLFGDERMIAIRTLLLLRMCINNGPQHCEEQARIAAWILHKFTYKIRGENKDTFFKREILARAISRKGISHEER